MPSIPTPKEIHRRIQKAWEGGQKAAPGHAERWFSEPTYGKLRARCLEVLKRDCRMSVGGEAP